MQQYTCSGSPLKGTSRKLDQVGYGVFFEGSLLGREPNTIAMFGRIPLKDGA